MRLCFFRGACVSEQNVNASSVDVPSSCEVARVERDREKEREKEVTSRRKNVEKMIRSHRQTEWRTNTLKFSYD